MGHAIEYITVDKRTDVMSAAEEFAFYNVDRCENPCGSYHGDMTIHDKPICESYEEAVKFIENHDEGFYSDHAVQYKANEADGNPESENEKMHRGQIQVCRKAFSQEQEVRVCRL